MKVNQNLEPSPIGKPSKTTGAGKALETKGAEQAASESAVAKLSGKSNELSAAPFRAERVAQIQEAIREGRFEINADAVASGIIESAKELLGQR